ncbi:MAG: aromatic ring-hydroxylating dioxygenase subunit alpha [Devosia sp.]|nr:aromatic ring-hydroxylating dioxygenase subunit alpha [Devosia sp.]
MNNQLLDVIQRSMDEQLERQHYPEGFPALPEVPAKRYYDPAFAAAEMEHIWKKSWLMVGLETDLPDHGSYLLFEQLGVSIIVIRGKDLKIRAFYNTCRHRASALLKDAKGKASRLLCPYHAWCYSLTGELIAVPNEHDFSDLNKETHGLKAVACDIWRGIIFINMGPSPEPLAGFMAPCVPHTDGFPLEGLVVKDHYFVKMDCNWKLAYHNFIESYHTPMVHPTSFQVVLDWRSLMAMLLDKGHSRLAVRKRERKSVYDANPDVSGAVSETFQHVSIVMSAFPNFYFALDPSMFALQTFWPAGPGKSIMEVRLVGWNTPDEDPERWTVFRKAFDEILDEDFRLFAGIQRGVENGAVPKMVIGYLERALYWFEEEIDRRIGPGNLPADARVVPVLAGQIER